MYLTSGHLPILYKESMFPPMVFSADLSPEEKAKVNTIGLTLEALEKEDAEVEAELRNRATDAADLNSLQQKHNELSERKEECESQLEDAANQPAPAVAVPAAGIEIISDVSAPEKTRFPSIVILQGISTASAVPTFVRVTVKPKPPESFSIPT